MSSTVNNTGGQWSISPRSNTVVATVVNHHTFTVDSRYSFPQNKILGVGSYGVVAASYDVARKENIAIKRVRPYAEDEIYAKLSLRELRCLKLLGSHPNVISLFGLSINEKKQELYYMMELMEVDLHKIISKSDQTLSEAHIKCLMKQLLEGLKAMHSVGVIHRDIKPANILVNQDCQLRITDFGLARFIDKSVRHPEEEMKSTTPTPLTEYVVTRWYRAPELLLAPTMAYSEAIDLWSAGCILAEMVNRRPLFPGQGYIDQVQQIFAVLGLRDAKDLGFPVSLSNITFLNTRCRFPGKSFARLFPSLSIEALDLLESLLTVNPSQRCNAPGALSFAFFADAETLFDYSDSSATVSLPSSDYFDFEKMTFDSSKFGDMIRKDVAEFCNGSIDLNGGDGSPHTYDGHDCSAHTDETGRTSIESADVIIEQDELDEEECAGNVYDTYEISVLPNGRLQRCKSFTVQRPTSVPLATTGHAVIDNSITSNNPFGKQNSSALRRERLKTFPVAVKDHYINEKLVPVPQVTVDATTQLAHVTKTVPVSGSDSDKSTKKNSVLPSAATISTNETSTASKFSQMRGYPLSKLRESLTVHRRGNTSSTSDARPSSSSSSSQLHLPAINMHSANLTQLEEGCGGMKTVSCSSVASNALTVDYLPKSDRKKRFSIDQEQTAQTRSHQQPLPEQLPSRRLSSLLANPLAKSATFSAFYRDAKDKGIMEPLRKSEWSNLREVDIENDLSSKFGRANDG